MKRRRHASLCDTVISNQILKNRNTTIYFFQVSKCKLCKQKYDPVPSKYEWGWAAYQCECGRAFRFVLF
jgi:ribosomal protein L24E